MNELDLPLRSPALYNPHLLSRDELLALFAAREDLLSELVSDLRATPLEEPAQHHLVIGQRGMGKTMLLRRLQVAVEDDPELGDTWLPLSFPEEQYNVVTLSDFWLNCVDALSDRLEAGERFPDAVEALDRAVEEIRNVQDETHRAERALDALVGTAESLGRRLLLLVDNADLILDRIGEQDWALREVLSSCHRVTFIGASAAMLESTYEYGRAFYDFFKIHELSGLSVEETKRFLLRYADAQGNAHVKQVVEAEPTRLRVLHTLTGGNPRTLVLLFNIFAHGAEGNVRADLEQLLDQCTPLYKARFEALPAQAQQVVDALALHWDPVSAGELAETLRMKVNQVSAQLNRLTQMGVVEKVPYEPASKTGFQIAERFFNIWYLMRASRRVRRRLIWLVEFLRMFYGQEELRHQVKSHLRSARNIPPEKRLRHAEYSFALASAFDDAEVRGALERLALQTLVTDPALYEQLLNFDAGDQELIGRASYIEQFELLKNRIDQLVRDPDEGVNAEFARILLRAPFSFELKAFILNSLDDEKRSQITQIDDWCFELLEDEELASTIRDALSNGYMLTLEDADGAKLAEEALDVTDLTAVAHATRTWLNCTEENIRELEASLERTTSIFAFGIWFRTGRSSESPEVAERHLTRALNLQPMSSTWLSLIAGYLEEAGLPTLARKALDSLIDHFPDPYSYFRLARFLVSEGKWDEATEPASRFIRAWNDRIPDVFWPDVVFFFRKAIVQGRVREAAELIDALDLGERWRPLREALEAIARGSDTYLRRVAPEVREPAEAILKELREPIETS